MFCEFRLVYRNSLGTLDNGGHFESDAGSTLEFDNSSAPTIPIGYWTVEPGVSFVFDTAFLQNLSDQEFIQQISSTLNLPRDVLTVVRNSELGVSVNINRRVVFSLKRPLTLYRTKVTGRFVKTAPSTALEFTLDDFGSNSPFGSLRRTRYHWNKLAERINSQSPDERQLRHLKFLEAFEGFNVIQNAFNLLDKYINENDSSNRTIVLNRLLNKQLTAWQKKTLLEFPEYQDAIMKLDSVIPPEYNVDTEDLIDAYSKTINNGLTYSMVSDEATVTSIFDELTDILKPIDDLGLLNRASNDLSTTIEISEEHSCSDAIDLVKKFLLDIKVDVNILSLEETNQVLDTIFSFNNVKLSYAMLMIFPEIENRRKQICINNLITHVHQLQPFIIFDLFKLPSLNVSEKQKLLLSFNEYLNDFEVEHLKQNYEQFYTSNLELFKDQRSGYTNLFGREISLSNLETQNTNLNFFIHPFYSLSGKNINSVVKLEAFIIKQYTDGNILYAVEIMQEYQKLRSVIKSNEQLVFLLPRYSKEFEFLGPLLQDIMGGYSFSVIESKSHRDGYIPEFSRALIKEKFSGRSVVFSGGYIDKCLSGAVTDLSKINISGIHDVSASSFHRWEIPTEDVSSVSQVQVNSFVDFQRVFNLITPLVRSLNEAALAEIYNNVSNTGTVESYRSFALMQHDDLEREVTMLTSKLNQNDLSELETKHIQILKQQCELMLRRMEIEKNVLGFYSIVSFENLIISTNTDVLDQVNLERTELFSDQNYSDFIASYNNQMTSIQRKIAILQ